MGLADVQRTLARLYTDADLRERFFDDPLRVARELGLTAEEARQLAELSSDQVHSFADSLHSKRFLEVGKLLPMTQRIVGDGFSTHFKEYARSYSPAGVKKHLGDALAFASFLERKVRGDREQPKWVLDLLRYEKARLKAADPSRRFVVARFRHDISRLVRSVARREEKPVAEKRFTVAIWWRPESRGMVRYAVISSPQMPRRRQSTAQSR